MTYMLFISLFCLKNWRFSTIICKGLLYPYYHHFKMIKLKLTGVFEILVHIKRIILKRELMFLNYTLNLKGRHYN